MPKTASELRVAYPDIITAIEQEAHKKGYDEGHATGRSEGLATGAETERERIKAIEDLELPGHDKLMHGLKYDGKTTAGEAAVQWAQADKKVRETKLDTFKKESPPVVAAAEAPPDKEDKKDFNTLVDEYRKEKGCSRTEAIKAVVAAHPEAHEAYLASIKPTKKED